jgi:hypothetical protein
MNDASQSKSLVNGLCARVSTARGSDLLGTFGVEPDGRIYFEAIYDTSHHGSIHAGDFVDKIPPNPLHGSTFNGEPITLLGAFCVSSTCGGAGLGKLRLLVNQLVIGVLVGSVKERLCDAVSVAPLELDRFVSHNGFRTSRTSSRGDVAGVVARYVPMNPVSIPVFDGSSVRYTVDLSDQYGTRTEVGSRSTIETAKSIGIRFAQAVSLEEAESEIGALCRMIGVLSGLELQFSRIRFAGKGLPSECAMYFAPVGTIGDRNLPVLTWPEIQPWFERVLAVWAISEPAIRLAIDQFVGSRPDRPGYLEDRIFAAFAGIDALHRLAVPKGGGGKKQGKLVALLAQFPSEVVEEFNPWVRESKRRLTDLRNDLAHGDRRLAPPLGKEEAVWVLWRLRLILWSLILSRLGVPSELILRARPGVAGRI